jgi:hypothetical protein
MLSHSRGTGDGVYLRFFDLTLEFLLKVGLIRERCLTLAVDPLGFLKVPFPRSTRVCGLALRCNHSLVWRTLGLYGCPWSQTAGVGFRSVSTMVSNTFLHRCSTTISNDQRRKPKGVPVTRNQVEFSWIRPTPSIAVSANPGTHLVALSTITSKGGALDRPLVNEEANYPLIGELKSKSEYERVGHGCNEISLRARAKEWCTHEEVLPWNSQTSRRRI